jgi:hypothetical protein
MKKERIALASLVLILLSATSANFQNVNAQYTEDGKLFSLASGVNIISPSNLTYTSTPILNITMRDFLCPDAYNVSVVYTVDGGDNVTLPVTVTFVPIVNTICCYLVAGNVELQPLTDGSHCMTVYANCRRINYVNGNWPALIYANKTVYFTVNDGTPPTIIDMSVTNTTYSQHNITLNVTTDEPTSWMGYSLDGNQNVTIAGNTTLISLTNGPHTLNVYTNDTVGNMGSSGTIEFNIDTASVELLTLEIGIPIAAAVLVVLLFVAFRKNRAVASN